MQNINEIEDYLTKMGYERDALQELILSEEEDLAKPKSISIAMNELMEKDLECSEVEEKEEDVE